MDLSAVPPTLFIASGVLTITALNLTNRRAVHACRSLWGVIAANYATALVLSVAMAVMGGLGSVSLITLGLGFVTGFLYIGGMFLGMTMIGRRGASIAVSASQLSVLIPVSLSVALFGESLKGSQFLGVTLALVSLPLLAAKGGKDGGAPDRGTLALLITMLLVQGFAQLSSKILVASGLEAERSAFFLAVFTSATLVTVPIALRHRLEVDVTDFGYGAVVGACNIGGNLSILLALVTLPGSVVFPLVSSGGLLLVTVLAGIIFRERVGRLNAVGMALTLLAVVLINI